MKPVLVLFALAFQTSVTAQKADSLIAVWHNITLHDTLRLNAALDAVDKHFSDTNPDTALIILDEQIAFAKEKKLSKWVGLGLNQRGLIHRTTGLWAEAISTFTEAVRIFAKEGMDKKHGAVLINLGNIYHDQGDYLRSLDSYRQAKDVFVGMPFQRGEAICLASMANVYQRQEDYEGALGAYTESLSVFRALEDKPSEANTLVNMGNVLKEMKKPEEALRYMHMGKVLFVELGIKAGLASCLNNLGTVYKDIKQFAEARSHFEAAKDLHEQTGNAHGMANAINNLGSVFLESGEPQKAIPMCLLALEMAAELGASSVQSDAAFNLFTAYKETNQYRLALDMSELYVRLQDSLLSESNTKAVLQQQFRHEFDKKEAILRAERAAEEALGLEQIARKNLQRNAFIGGFGLMAVLAAVTFRNYRRKKKDNETITLQKAAVEQKNKEILDSINYAKRLQEAVLPPPGVVKSYFNDSFLLYRPKDIVSGDFYWMEQKDDTHYLAVGDCTGHGVPGAMLSVLGLNGLNRCLHELNLTAPDAILSRLSAFIRSSFEKSEVAIHDGMDIALCALNLKSGVLQYASANIQLIIVRNGEMLITSADKHSVGFNETATGFQLHEIAVLSGDNLYLCTDGFESQLRSVSAGQPGSDAFEDMLLNTSSLPMLRQREALSEALIGKDKALIQTEDVCIIGIRI